MAVSYKDFIHPEDAKALQMLKNIPGYTTVSRGVMKLGIEPYYHSTFMADYIRLSPSQLPKIYGLLPPVCQKFGIEEPEFYLQMDPAPGAFTLGDKRCFVVITSGLLDCVTDPLELQSILAHECAHIMCRHAFYNTLAQVLLSGDIPIKKIVDRMMGGAGKIKIAEKLPVVGTAVTIGGVVAESMYVALLSALHYWGRRSELSCDRASAVFCGNVETPAKALMRLTGGPSRFTSDINIEEFANQTNDKDFGTKWEKVLRGMKIMMQDHPFAVTRIQELNKFGQSAKYQELVTALREAEFGRVCKKCGRPISEKQKFCRFCGQAL